MQSLQAMLAQMNRGAAAALGKAAEEMGDRIKWRPLSKGRSALDQILECGWLYLFSAQIFSEQGVPPIDSSFFEKLYAENNTREKALALLARAGEDFAQSLEAFPSDKLEERVVLPFGGGLERTFVELALMCYWNTVYHEGQVNYIQTLYAE